MFVLRLRAASRPEANAPEPTVSIGRDRLNRLVESLANHNEKPVMVPVNSSIALHKNPLFADDYDWDEDTRVWWIIWEFEKYNSEELWRCLTEHLDDERYVLAYAFDDRSRIVSIGGLCRSAARDYLDGAYMRHLPISMDGNAPAMRLFSPEGVGPWCRDHAGMPLYQQQAELCEAAIIKMHTMPRVPDADKAKFTADVKQQIDALLRTRQPWLAKGALLPNGVGIEDYNAQLAKEVKDEYMAEHGLNEHGTE